MIKLSGGPIVPTEEEIFSFNKHQDLIQAVDRQVQILVNDEGHTEVENFLKLHKIYLPCFNWIIEDQEDDGDYNNDKKVAKPTDSFVRGS